eukprot:g14584.t1
MEDFLRHSQAAEAVNFRRASAVLCTIPFYFCRLFKRFLGVGENGKRLIMYLGLPLHQDVPQNDRIANLAEIMDLARRLRKAAKSDSRDYLHAK